MRVPVRPGTVRLGRSLDNDIVLPDDKVSRHHGQIGVRLGMLVYTDLGSTTR
jgi:pSer/pThr/pTyr-binding forkhead associated (FHA) protein